LPTTKETLPDVWLAMTSAVKKKNKVEETEVTAGHSSICFAQPYKIIQTL
jgi:hypothetical protein